MATFESKLEAFLENYEKLKSVQNEEAFLKEFMKLKGLSAQYKEQNIFPAESGQLSINRKKNRFKDIVPFEYTRVSLHSIEGVEGSDYVNANYIQGADGSVTYIAAQGPLPHTTDDFWRMLWYHNIEIVVMACKLIEMAKPKCECYWPALNESKLYGPITVTTVHEEEVDKKFIIRDFVAECEGEKQKIRQYHYSSWPDHGRPSEPRPVLRMIDTVHNYRQRMDVPILVHCSAGCGRTGTIIAIDIARTMILNKSIPESFMPFEIVENMRKQRPAMVQAKEQYVFVFMAMAVMAKEALNTKEVKEEVAEDNLNYENCTTVTAPMPAPREGAEEKQPIAPPRTNQAYENVAAPSQTASSSSSSTSSSSSSAAAVREEKMERKQSPPRPKPRGGGGPSPEGSLPRPTPPPKPQRPQSGADQEIESQYSVVDMTQLRDTGPEIKVVNEDGLSAPLSEVEQRLHNHSLNAGSGGGGGGGGGGGSANTSRSILETIMNEVGDLMDEEDNGESSAPPPLPPPNPPPSSSKPKWSDFEDEVPPPIPLHTEASTHILEPQAPPPAPPTVSDSEHLVIDSGIYYAPTPHSVPMPASPSSPKSHTSPPHFPSSALHTTTTSTPISSAATLPPPSTSTTPSSSSSTGKSSRLKIFKGIGKSKSEKRKQISVSDIGRPTGLGGDNSTTSPPRNQSPSPEHGINHSSKVLSDLGPAQSEPANNRYTFPGDMGYGLRIPSPRGPRPEPPHWNVIRNSVTAI